MAVTPLTPSWEHLGRGTRSLTPESTFYIVPGPTVSEGSHCFLSITDRLSVFPPVIIEIILFTFFSFFSFGSFLSRFFFLSGNQIVFVFYILNFVIKLMPVTKLTREMFRIQETLWSTQHLKKKRYVSGLMPQSDAHFMFHKILIKV